ncbi:MAG: helix-turn-helix domain-containing protein [Firmicutes bacterium]|nr:helix-turn-helix domain-containing protein [Bacillota bacterium]
MSIGSNIKKRRRELGLTLEELSGAVGVSRQTLSRYETGVIANIPPDKVERLAAALSVTPAALMGWQQPELQPYEPTRTIPILGRIAAGLPLYADEHIEGYVTTDLSGGDEYFALRVKGDSMDAAHIFDGNVLIIRKQDMVENGEIAVVMIDGDDATVKRFYCCGDTVTLMPQSTNPAHLPQIYDMSRTSVRVLGKVVRSQISFE